ncbi:hypothetical protein [Devosia ginsengisoli]|uniref:hypothetical protein n=1 Tax=Devosia ginsengisoli TaxID=400770 RepID=UPI001FE53D22|nr:hypothetical protein [Devosia ginsengisoli]
MALLNFDMRRDALAPQARIADAIGGWSIEVMPRTAAKVENFRALLPEGTLVYVAHIAGTPIEDMVATARRLHDEGFAVMPHFPARGIADRAMLEDWIRRYRDEAGVSRALLLGGGNAAPVGGFPLFDPVDRDGTVRPARLYPIACGGASRGEQGHRPGGQHRQCRWRADVQAGFFDAHRC